MTAFQVFTFNEAPNVLWINPFTHAGASVVPLKVQANNPFTGRKIDMVYRNTSLRGRQIYYYRPSTEKGEIRGG